MLTPIETVLFVLLVFICAVAAYYTWGQMFRIINRGQRQLYFDNLAHLESVPCSIRAAS